MSGSLLAVALLLVAVLLLVYDLDRRARRAAADIAELRARLVAVARDAAKSAAREVARTAEPLESEQRWMREQLEEQSATVLRTAETIERAVSMFAETQAATVKEIDDVERRLSRVEQRAKLATIRGGRA